MTNDTILYGDSNIFMWDCNFNDGNNKEYKMTKEQIHNIYLHMTGKAEGLLEAGAEADFPVMFAKAIMKYNKPCELTEDEIREVADSVCHTWKKNGVGELYMTDFARAILKKAGEK